MMETKLAAEVRHDQGKGVARKLRRTGRLPAVLYANGGEATSLTIDPFALTEIFRVTNNRNTVVLLQLEDREVPALLKAVQKHPVSRELIHVDFYEVGGERMIEAQVPVRTTGRPVGAAQGGRLRVIRREVSARSRWDQIPSEFIIDVSKMDINDMIMASEIDVPEGVDLIFDNDFNVVTVYGRRVQEEN